MTGVKEMQEKEGRENDRTNGRTFRDGTPNSHGGGDQGGQLIGHLLRKEVSEGRE
jgi:hypothetical protein